ncbi:MAG TPA: ester cyclase [Candidatus Dormibacteraeota bacterium]|nr:ester cyclase [Candidatus Dormibacteraeota bacterium]
MSAEQNKVNSRRFLEDAANRGSVDLLDELADPNCVVHQADGVGGNDIRGREAFKQFLKMYYAAFPDLHFTVEDQVAEGDKVVTRWSSEGTHNGELMGIAPTGKHVASVTGITIDRYSGGKFVEGWGNWDTLGLMQKLGVIPALAQPAATRR